MSRFFLGTTVLLGALASSAVAQAAPLKLEIGAFGGYHYFATTNQLGRNVGSTDENRLGPHTGTFGLRLGF